MARVTRLELAASGVTGRRSNQLSYTRIVRGAVYIKTVPEWQVFFDRFCKEKCTDGLCLFDLVKGRGKQKSASEKSRRLFCTSFPIREGMARVTRLELAASGVTGRRSNQLSYTRIVCGAVYIRGGSVWQGLFCKKKTPGKFTCATAQNGPDLRGFHSLIRGINCVFVAGKSAKNKKAPAKNRGACFVRHSQ